MKTELPLRLNATGTVIKAADKATINLTAQEASRQGDEKRPDGAAPEPHDDPPT